jgi:hypothetical protein
MMAFLCFHIMVGREGYDREQYNALRRKYGAEGWLADLHAKVHVGTE